MSLELFPSPIGKCNFYLPLSTTLGFTEASSPQFFNDVRFHCLLNFWSHPLNAVMLSIPNFRTSILACSCKMGAENGDQPQKASWRHLYIDFGNEAFSVRPLERSVYNFRPLGKNCLHYWWPNVILRCNLRPLHTTIHGRRKPFPRMKINTASHHVRTSLQSLDRPWE